MAAVIERAEDITAAWLTETLTGTGALRTHVEGVVREPIGAGVGLMSTLARLSIDYAGAESLPRSMIAKFAPANDNRAVARLLDFYNREANFYNRLATTCPFRVPETYFGAVNQDTYDFVLLLEDLGDVAPNDQIGGASAPEAMEKVRAIARLHAMYWGKVGASEFGWMYDYMSPENGALLRDSLYLRCVDPAITNFADHFTPRTRDICRRAGEQLAEVLGMIASPRTFVHGDYRQDNFIYRAGERESVVMDWQISGAGPGIFDVAYFVCQSLRTDLRREIERPLLQAYLAELRSAGVDDYGFDAAWQDYRLCTLFCLIYPMTVCGTLDLANARGRALGECMLDRNLRVIEDLGCDEFLS